MVNKYIFREYDIRGKVVDDFPPHVVTLLGRSFGTLVKRNGFREIALSGDIRLTTPDLMDQFKEGVLATGTDVINLGLLPTPTNYYSMFKLGIGGAVQITGSHNPPEFNGFKMSMDRKAVYGDSIQTLRKYIEDNDFETGTGSEIKHDIRADYKAMIIEKI
ncbi:MAG: phosphomannomutase, partial [Candidatus Marinimicrobia bacterium]|nr:phosphomannomutase [Candidatus Neomarinimicrobiota bacterium]